MISNTVLKYLIDYSVMNVVMTVNQIRIDRFLVVLIAINTTKYIQLDKNDCLRVIDCLRQTVTGTIHA